MLTGINQISIPIPHTEKRADLMLDGKNLIITGGNGSGKTSFIESIYKFLQDGLSDSNNNDLSSLMQNRDNYLRLIKQGGRDQTHYAHYANELKNLEEKIDRIRNFKIITLSKENSDARSLLRFHKALREASISAPQSAPRLASMKESNAHFPNEKDGDDIFENYLISLKTAQSYAIAFDKDEIKADKIQAWFDKIEVDLQGLFEDSNLKLNFDSDEGKFFLVQEGKNKFTFQTLSSGYSSILRIYADLIMRVEMWELTPKSIEGIIFIDEIDAHLHVSLQKQILRFFAESFPNVQFIVTTHSPFVVASVTDAVIYDLTSNQKITDVSSYSYNIILQELFGVDTISKALSDKLEKIKTLIENIDRDNVDSANDMLKSLASSEEIMDNEASAFIDFAKMKIRKYRKENAQEE